MTILKRASNSQKIIIFVRTIYHEEVPHNT